MKSFFIGLFLCHHFIASAGIVTWDGEAGDGLWITAANWSGNVLPAPGDAIVLDNSLVAGTYTVSLPGGNTTVSVLSIVITPTGTNTITLLLPVANIANPGLSVTGIGDVLVINRGGVLKNSSGASPGSGLLIAGVFRINNGGRYIHNTRSGNAAIVTQLSTAAGTETGVFEYNVPAATYTLSLSGRTYGTLELSSTANAGTANYIGSGASALNITGDLVIHTGVSCRVSMSADITIGGNYTQGAASLFDMQTSTGNNFVKIKGNVSSLGTLTKSGTGLPTMELMGTANQDVNITGIFSSNITVNINNVAGATLLSPLTLPYNLKLSNGKIRTTIANMLTMTDNSTYTGGSASSFIEGPMRKTGDDATFVFPVGKGSIYAPVGFHSMGMAITDTYVAEYIRANPQSAFGINYESLPAPQQFDHISYVEYWMLRKTNGTSIPVEVQLTVTPYSFSKNLGSIFIARYNTADMQWKGAGVAMVNAGAPSPPYVTGAVTSLALAADGVFTLYSSDNYFNNPLPVDIIYFTVSESSVGKAWLQWKMGDVHTGTVVFEVQRAGVDQQFKTISTVGGSSINDVYSYADDNFQDGVNYYRLKIIDQNESVVYSRVVQWQVKHQEVWVTSLSFNNNKITWVVMSARRGPIRVMIADRQGRIVNEFSRQLVIGRNEIDFFTHRLLNGCYFLWGVVEGQNTTVSKFIKY